MASKNVTRWANEKYIYIVFAQVKRVQLVLCRRYPKRDIIFRRIFYCNQVSVETGLDEYIYIGRSYCFWINSSIEVRSKRCNRNLIGRRRGSLPSYIPSACASYSYSEKPKCPNIFFRSSTEYNNSSLQHTRSRWHYNITVRSTIKLRH